MSVTIKAVADAIAAMYVGLTANGESIGIGPTASLPNSIPTRTVAVLVYPPTAELGISLGQSDDRYQFPVKILRDPIDVPARTDALYAWLEAGRYAISRHTSLQLGPTIIEATARGLRAELDGESYGDDDHPMDVVEWIVEVFIQEPVPGLAV